MNEVTQNISTAIKALIAARELGANVQDQIDALMDECERLNPPKAKPLPETVDVADL